MSRKKQGKAIKILRFGFFALILGLVLSVAFNYLSNKTYAFEVNDNGYGLEISSERIEGQNNNGKLFNIDNMAPGEEYTEAVTLENVGSESFQSMITAVNTSTQGDLLFDSLNFTIRKGSPKGAVLFNGKLKDLKNIVVCSLNGSNQIRYYMTLSLPAESGNEYQSQHASFKFIITADAVTPAQ